MTTVLAASGIVFANYEIAKHLMLTMFCGPEKQREYLQ
jgi:hypothetical protein